MDAWILNKTVLVGGRDSVETKLFESNKLGQKYPVLLCVVK